MDSSCYSLMFPYKTAQQLQIYKVFSLPVPHSNLSGESKINYKCIGVTYGETKAVAIRDLQYRSCQHANGQICRINGPFQPLTNPPSCVTALYAKNDQTIKERCSLVISDMPHTYVPIVVTSNLWIIPSNPHTQRSTHDNDLPKATIIVPLQKAFHMS